MFLLFFIYLFFFFNALIFFFFSSHHLFLYKIATDLDLLCGCPFFLFFPCSSIFFTFFFQNSTHLTPKLTKYYTLYTVEIQLDLNYLSITRMQHATKFFRMYTNMYGKCVARTNVEFKNLAKFSFCNGKKKFLFSSFFCTNYIHTTREMIQMKRFIIRNADPFLKFLGNKILEEQATSLSNLSSSTFLPL